MAGLEWRIMIKALKAAAAKVPFPKKTKWPVAPLAHREGAIAGAMPVVSECLSAFIRIQ